MNVYMATYTRQTLTKDIYDEEEKWADDMKSNHTFFVFAENDVEANEYVTSALSKRNEYSATNERYTLNTAPKQIHVMSVTHDIHSGTSVTGIWD